VSNQNDGGPAFPLTASTGDPRDGVYCQNGMTLRDWFAGQALISAPQDGRFTTEELADGCYEMADAMLKARGGAA
jgi:hypothetical protein